MTLPKPGNSCVLPHSVTGIGVGLGTVGVGIGVLVGTGAGCSGDEHATRISRATVMRAKVLVKMATPLL